MVQYIKINPPTLTNQNLWSQQEQRENLDNSHNLNTRNLRRSNKNSKGTLPGPVGVMQNQTHSGDI